MYLAPLNYDRFFKKVFSDLKIAKAFLEDFLEVNISSIELLENTKRFTDNAAIVDFDFRVKIDDQYVIVDMQQWYKPDVAQRFFLYHALNSGLQLESLPEKKLIIDKITGKTKEIKDYRRLEPVTTLVWMVHDTLGFEVNYAAYRLMPHAVADFLTADKLWNTEEIKSLLEHRVKVMRDLENNHKGMAFIAQNSLTFMFQKNIIQSPKIERYKDWFVFAEKTRDPDNKPADFEAYETHEVFSKIIKRINQTTLTPNDIQYIHDEDELTQEIERWESGVYEDGHAEGVLVGQEQGHAQGRKEGEEGALNIIREAIMDALQLKYGAVPKKIHDTIHSEADLKRLKAALISTIQSASLEDFLQSF